MACADSATDAVEVGSTADGFSLFLPITTGVPITIVGGAATGKTTLSAHLLHRARQNGWRTAYVRGTQPDARLVIAGTPFMSTFLVLDECDALIARVGASVVHDQLAERGICAVLVTQSLGSRAFGGDDWLHRHCRSGTIIHLRSGKVGADALARSVHPQMELGRLERRGHGYVSAPDGCCAEIRFSPHATA